MAFPENFDTAVGDVSTHEDRSTEELDALADAGSSASNKERPMKEDAPAPAKAAADKVAEELYEIEHAGKKIKASKDQLIKWAQMGYDRPQVMQKFNQEKFQWEQERQKWEKQWGVYKEVDAFAQQNRDWWNFVQGQYQNRGTFTPGQPVSPNMGTEIGNPGTHPTTPPGGYDPYAPKLAALEQKLGMFEQIAQKFQEKEIQQQEQAEDAKLDQEVRSIREAHKDLDWDTPDMNGKSLELRVLEHAQQNGIPSFKAAFRDLLHDDLLMRAEAQAKVAVSKGIQAKTKLGVLGSSPTPRTGLPASNKDIRKQSYNDLEREALEEVRALNANRR